jgi:hypothetical protein
MSRLLSRDLMRETSRCVRAELAHGLAPGLPRRACCRIAPADLQGSVTSRSSPQRLAPPTLVIWLRELIRRRYYSRNLTGRDPVQDMRDSVAADVAAERLDRSPHELRRLLRAGQVCAHRRAGRWFVALSEVRRLQRLPQPVGRPFSPGSAWALLAMLAGDEPADLSPPRRSQLRRHLLDADIGELAARLSRRASRRLVYAHPSMLQALAADPRVVPTGLAAAERAGARLVAAEDGDVEGYVAESDIAGLYATYGLVDADEVADVILRVVDEAAQVPRRSGVVAPPVLGLDLWESGDARASEEGRRLFAEALETFRER